jgi:hypothetical protein
LNCKCGKSTRVVDTRSVKGLKYRRRICNCGNAFYTKEITCKDFPYKVGGVYKLKDKPKPEPEKPTMEFNGIPVTKDSPAWVKRLATLINK